jgi:hypothetical protein
MYTFVEREREREREKEREMTAAAEKNARGAKKKPQ